VTIRPLLILLATLAAAVVGVLAAPAPAQAAKPCWSKLINDWYDGRIDGVYPVKCYRDAIKHLPTDVEAYSDAREQIERALLSAMRKSGGTLKADDPVPAQTNAVPTQQTEASTDSSPGGDNQAGGPPAGGGQDDGGGPIGDAFKPANADSVPIPLLVLAGLALVLLAAASAGFVARRIQARKVRVSPLPGDRKTP
jgi:hypothetical protein